MHFAAAAPAAWGPGPAPARARITAAGGGHARRELHAPLQVRVLDGGTPGRGEARQAFRQQLLELRFQQRAALQRSRKALRGFR
ncbi:hypothetical protein D3C74_277570 [compost metagenome]